jgi:LuxR family transcriptional regulator, maltose regulon positive regulatory protein
VLETLARTPWGTHLNATQVAALRHWSAVAGRAVPTVLPAAQPAAPAPAAVRPATGAPTQIVAPMTAGAAASEALLSAREHEVLSRLAAGDSNKLIARTFDLSPHTVKRHVANILDKLALESRGQAAAWYRARQQDR